MPTPARRAAFEILLRVETQASYAAELLHGPLAANLTERDAALCTELVQGTLRWQGTLDFIAQHFAATRWERFDPEVRIALRLGLYQLRFTRVPSRAAVSESVELVKAARKVSAAGLVNAVLRKGGEVKLASLRPPDMAEFEWRSIETSHPAWMLERWTNQYGPAEALALARSNNQPPVTYLRSAGLSRSLAEIAEALRQESVETRPGTFLKSCLAVEKGNIAKTKLLHRGDVVVQDEASQIVPHLLDVQAGHTVLDLCAAPGNKTGLLARWTAPTGYVVACDIHLHRLRQCARPLQNNVHRVALDGERPLPFAAQVDRILVDAPCSGTGTLRRNPELKWRLKPADITALAEKQLRLLESAASVLKPGGRIVYSTCSLEHEENQDAVARFLAAHPEFDSLPLHADAPRLSSFFNEAAERLLAADYLATSPARDATDGFFAAILTTR